MRTSPSRAGVAREVATPGSDVDKAKDLSGTSGLLFRRNARTGAPDVPPRSGTWGGLSAELHAND